MALQDDMSWELNKELVGTFVEVVVANDTGRKGFATDRLSGRAKDGRLVHFTLPAGHAAPRPGDVATTMTTQPGGWGEGQASQHADVDRATLLRS